MADEPFVDTHAHFWDKSVEGLAWAWLEPGFSFRHWSASGELDAPRYGPEDLRAEAEGCGLAGVVHVHAADPVDDPALETAWLERVADEHGIPNAIVGRCVLAEPDAPDILRRHAEHPRFRGIRDHTALDHLAVDEVAPAMDVLDEVGASVELRRSHDQFGVLHEIASRWPAVTVTLSQGCLPLERSPEELRAWSAAMRDLAAARPNVACKISAVAGASDPDWTPQSIRPWVLACVEAFGADRCMFGSNWPVDRLFGTFRGLVDAYREVTAELDAAERAAIFHGTAERVYGLEPVTGG